MSSGTADALGLSRAILCNGKIFIYYFKNEFVCLIMVSEHEKAMNYEGRSLERFITFDCLGSMNYSWF